jgi:hypothetical protein
VSRGGLLRLISMMYDDFLDPFEEDEEERKNKLLLLALIGELDEDMQEELDLWLDSEPGYRKTFDLLMDPDKRKKLMAKYTWLQYPPLESDAEFPIQFSQN